ncbi:YqzM family protein [Paenibacillus thermoaerophilus]|uniref:YqzM family protein n=1 Tax=Paenibacillus thermoaerophilus TaxID=1215385 RepID=A0ABW2V105_9BACL|nr:YqzM family protein [Paenibacillus thermoaerophilus]TMV18376.1 YqzM family protein [Paenibacillus thermoaerophilus]
MSEAKAYHPEEHVNEEPRNDLIDVGMGFIVTFGFFLLIAVIFTVIEIMTQ